MQPVAASSNMKSDAAAVPLPKTPLQGKGHKTGTLKIDQPLPPPVVLSMQYAQAQPASQSPPFRSRAFEALGGLHETYEERMQERKMKRCVCVAITGLACMALVLGLTLKYA